jgi:hypothetical protein
MIPYFLVSGCWQLATKTKFKDLFESKLGYLPPLPSPSTYYLAGTSMEFLLCPQSLLIQDHLLKYATCNPA